MPTKPLETHVDSQPGEIIEEFFLAEIPDPDVPLDANPKGAKTVKRVMVKLYAGEFSKPTRRASVEDKNAHPTEWAAFEEKAKAAGEELPVIDNTLPPEEGEGLEKPDGQPPLGGSLAGAGHPSGQPVVPQVEPHESYEPHKRHR